MSIISLLCNLFSFTMELFYLLLFLFLVSIVEYLIHLHSLFTELFAVILY